MKMREINSPFSFFPNPLSVDRKGTASLMRKGKRRDKTSEFGDNSSRQALAECFQSQTLSLFTSGHRPLAKDAVRDFEIRLVIIVSKGKIFEVIALR